MMRKSIFILSGFLFLLTGCAGAPIRTHERFKNYFSDSREKTITLMPIDIKFYQLSAGGIPEQIDEWDIQSDALFRKIILQKIDPLPKIKIKILEENQTSGDMKLFLDGQNGLYRALAESIIAHTYVSGSIFPNKIKNFDYTLGNEIGIINDNNPTDALLFFSGSRTYWTAGRVMLATWGVLLGAATGIMILPQSVPDWVAVALVDAKTGDILWFRYMGSPNVTIGDLREERIVSDTVDYLFRDFYK